MKNKRWISVPVIALVAGVGIAGPGMAAKPTDADVGDADSFGKRVVWAGFLQTGQVVLLPNCSSFTGGADDHCVTVDPAGSTNFDVPDVGRITLPGNSARTLICHSATYMLAYNFMNASVVSNAANISVAGSLRLESPVLQNPSLINPLTHLPFNGGIDVRLPRYAEGDTLAPGAGGGRDIQTLRTCVEGLISTKLLTTTYGLTDAQAKNVFASPITIRAGVAGFVSLVPFAQIAIGTRFTADE